MNTNKENAGAVKEPKEKRAFNKKKLKYGSIATVVTVIFIAAVVLVNLIAGQLSKSHDLKLDLTKDQYYEVSQQTIDYIKNIDRDVEISVMNEKSDFDSSKYMKMVVETLDKYQQNSDRVKVEYYDIEKNPEIVSKYSKYYSGEIKDGNIVIASGERVKVISVNDMFTQETNYQTYSTQITGFKGEQAVTSAVMSVTDANPVKVAYLSLYNGSAVYHSNNEYAVQAMRTLLDKNGYEVTDVDLLNDELTADKYDLAVLPAPMNDLTESDIDKLDAFMYNDGKLGTNLVYIADINQYATPNLDEFLSIWGIEVDDSVVFNSDENQNKRVTLIKGSMPSTASGVVAEISDDEFKSGISNGKLPIVAPVSRAINLLFDANNDRNTTAILKTSDSSYLYPLNLKTLEEAKAEAEAKADAEEKGEEETEESTEFDEDSAERAEQIVMAMATKSKTGTDADGEKNNLMVIGSTSIVDHQIVQDNSYNNAEFIVNAVNKMCGKENGIIIAEKNLSTSSIDITEAQVSGIKTVIMAIIPLIIVAVGIVVFVRRRNR